MIYHICVLKWFRGNPAGALGGVFGGQITSWNRYYLPIYVFHHISGSPSFTSLFLFLLSIDSRRSCVLFAVNTRPLKSYLSHSPTNVLQWLKCIMHTQNGHSFDYSQWSVIIHFVFNITYYSKEILWLTIRYHFQLRQSADANFANSFWSRLVVLPAAGHH